jgi:glutamate carboxypeptidase
MVTNYVKRQQGAMVQLLRRMVEIESPSENKKAVDQLGALVIDEIQAIGGTAERIGREEVGDIVIGRWPGADSSRPSILLLCHMDTVWPSGTLAERPPREESGRLYGPGVYDMKSGLVIALAAIEYCATQRGPLAGPVTLLCTSDEETGSLHSREVIEALAAESGLVLCLEPALANGELKTARKGVGMFSVTTRGRAAHAGGNHEQGRNAIEEMAHQVLAVQQLTDYTRGTTVNVGTISGGVATNVVPAVCRAEVDFRVELQEEADRIDRAFRSLQPNLEGTGLEVDGGLNRPPMVRDDLMARTFEQAHQIALNHGMELREGSTGGASDANLTAAMGVPTLDGLGAVGDGAHAVDEHVRIDSLPERAALLEWLLCEWEWV